MNKFKKLFYMFLDTIIALACIALLFLKDFQFSAPKCFFLILIYAAINVFSGRYVDNNEDL
jgi:hypothetical protein